MPSLQVLNLLFGSMNNEYSLLKHSSLAFSVGFVILPDIYASSIQGVFLLWDHNRKHCWYLTKLKSIWYFSSAFHGGTFPLSFTLIKHLMHKVHLLLISILHGCYLTTGTFWLIFFSFSYFVAIHWSLKGIQGACYLNLC